MKLHIKLAMAAAMLAALLFLSACQPGKSEVLKCSVVSTGGITQALFALHSGSYSPKPGDVLEYSIRANINPDSIRPVLSPTEKTGAPVYCPTKPRISSKWKKCSLPVKNAFTEVYLSVNGIFDSDAKAEIWLKDIKITNKGKIQLAVYSGSLPKTAGLIDYTDTVKQAFMDSCGEKEPLRDTLSWMNCTLPENCYIGIHAENLNEETGRWESSVGVYQPFRSSVCLPWNTVFWHKDDMADYYGELFTFDQKLLRLHSETFPPKTPVDPEDQEPWMAKPGRCRLFVADKDGKNTYNMAEGRIMATMDGSTRSDFDGYMDTFMASSFEELNTTPRKFQDNVHDHVFITREKNFSTVYDGEMEGWEAEDTMKHFDEVWIINQCMNNNEARERFIFGRKGETCYGAIRWDNSVMRDGKWKVINRATGLKIVRQTGPFSFEGFKERVVSEDRIAPADTAFSLAAATSINHRVTPKSSLGIGIVNTGRRVWEKPLLWARLRNPDFSLVEGSQVMLAESGLLKPFETGTFNTSLPESWKSGTYFLELDVTDGGTPFANPKKHTAIKHIIIE